MWVQGKLLTGFAYPMSGRLPAKSRMRLRLTIALALCGSIGALDLGRAQADDFDDDFGKLPPAAKPVAAKPVPPARPATAAPAPAAPSPPAPAARPSPAPRAPAQRPATTAARPPAPALADRERAPAPAAVAPAAVAPAGDEGAPETPYPPLDENPELTAGVPAHRRKLRAFVHPTVSGLVGGVHVVDASSAWPGTFRIAFNAAFFRKDGFIARGDQHRHGGAVLNLDVTPIEHLELAAQIGTHGTQNRTSDPQVLQVVGDTRLYAKGFTDVLPWLTVAGDAELALLNGVGSIGVAGRATSVGLRTSATADLRALEHKPLPLIVRSNLRYLFDNSGRLMRGIEGGRYASLGNAAAREDEYRHLLSPAERAGLQVNRVDRINLSVGLEAPLMPRERVHVSPLLEWNIALPVNRQGYDCVDTRLPGQRDSCLAQEGFAARPSFFTFGVRAQPYVSGLAVLAAIDVASGGHKTFVRELAPLERYMIRVGLSYAYDPRKAPVARPRIQRVEIPASSARGHVVGQVVESESGAPVSGAVVHFEATSLSDVVSDDQGAFRSAELGPGAQGMRVRAEGFREALCVAVLSASGGDVDARCELTPSTYYGVLRGRVADRTGKPVVGAHLALRGQREQLLTTQPDGSFGVDKLPVGAYEATITAEGYFAREARFSVERGSESAPTVSLLARPDRPLVRRTPKRILLLRPLQFSPDSAVIASESEPMLGELAELLKKTPALARIEVQGHVDDASPSTAQTLSEQRAQAVRAWLVAEGVAEARLEAKGYGATRPLAPNITAQNRARNRRIELLIK